MQTEPQNISLKQAIELAKSGQKTPAARLLADILRDNPNDAAAWLWLSGCVDEPEQQAFCLRQVLRIQPDNRAAQHGLEELSAGKQPPAPEVTTRDEWQPENEAEATQPVQMAVEPMPVTGAMVFPLQHGALVFDVPPSRERTVQIPATAVRSSDPTLENPAVAASTGPTVQIAGTQEAPPVQPARERETQKEKEQRSRVLRLVLGIVFLAVLVLVILRLNSAAGGGQRPFSIPGVRLASADVRVRPGGDLAAAVQNAPEGGSVVLQAGNYELSQPLVITRAVTVRGAGMNATRIRSSAAGSVVRVQTAGRVELSDLEILLNGQQAGDVVVVERGTLQMDGCRLGGARLNPADGGGGRGLAFEQEAASGEVSGSEMLDNSLAGISIAGGEINASQNAVHDNGQYGILISGSANPKLEENSVDRNGQAGIAVLDQAKGTLRQNHLEQNGASGIRVEGYAAPLVYSNTSQGNAQFGIEIRGQSAPVLMSNVVQRNGKAGLGYFDSAAGAAEQNDCSQNELHGISVNENASPFLKENHCTNNRQVGIDYWGSSGGTAANNECSQNGLQGIAVHEHAQPVLQNNICKGNSDSGIIYWGSSGGSASNNECSENQINGISVHDQAQPTLVKNTCRQNLATGIAFYEQAGGEARENECLQNGTDAISQPEGSSAVLANNRCGTR